MVSYSEIVRALKEGTERRPELADTVNLYCALLEIQEREQVAPPERIPTVDEARARLEEGLPLLEPDQLEIDAHDLAELCARIGFAIAERRRERVKALAQIHAWLHERRRQVKSLAVEYLRNGHVPGNNRAEIDRGLLTFILSSALRPFLRAQSQVLAPLVDDGKWYRSYCPICGGEPDMAALEKGRGGRRLLCSRCDSEWTFRRLGCPFCGNEEPAQLAHYPSDDEMYRLHVCERCRRYLKTIDLRGAVGEHPLPAQRILTVAMDMAAEAAGYRGGA
jgi:FdhE protein